MELEDVLWRDIAEANLEHDAPHERRLCDELRRLVPRQLRPDDVEVLGDGCSQRCDPSLATSVKREERDALQPHLDFPADP